MSLYIEHLTLIQLIQHRHSHIKHALNELPEISPLSVRHTQTNGMFVKLFELLNVHNSFNFQM